MSCHSHCSHEHHDSPPVPTNASQTLIGYIDVAKVRGLNVANPPEDVVKLFTKDRTTIGPIVRSDCDSQIIIHIPFINSSVKLYLILLRTSQDILHCPKTIKLYKNDTEIDFDNVDHKKPTHILDHPLIGLDFDMVSDDTVEDEDDGVVEHYLPRQKFTGLTSLTIFIADNWAEDDDEEVELSRIELRGSATELRKEAVVTLYELAANPADHNIEFLKETGTQGL